jgi:hypothetical protein
MPWQSDSEAYRPIASIIGPLALPGCTVTPNSCCRISTLNACTWRSETIPICVKKNPAVMRWHPWWTETSTEHSATRGLHQGELVVRN